MKKVKEEKDDIVEKIEKVKKEKKKIPKEVANQINKRLFSNILIAVVIMIYFILISLGNVNIEQPAFIVDLKVFSITLLVLSVIIFEKSYKKDDGALCIYGIETLVLAIITLLSVYVNLLINEKFVGLVSIASFGFAIYYVVKATLIYIRDKNAYIKGQNDITEIIKPEEPEKVKTRLKKSEVEKIEEEKKKEEEKHKESIREKMLKALNRKPNKSKEKDIDDSKKEENSKEVKTSQDKKTAKAGNEKETIKKKTTTNNNNEKKTSNTTKKKTEVKAVEENKDKKETNTKTNTTTKKQPSKSKTQVKKKEK